MNSNRGVVLVRAVTALALVLLEVMQAPALFLVMHAPAAALGMLITRVLAGLSGDVSAG